MKIGIDTEYAAEILTQGGLVGIPTETVYGLAGNATDEHVVKKIFKAKNRPSNDPLIVHLHAVEEVKKYVRDCPDELYDVARHFWPGPLTILLPKTSTIPDCTTSGSELVGLRVPNHALTLDLLRRIPFPLAAPSANPFSYISPTTAQHVLDQLSDQVDYILDGGPCGIGVESTIVSYLDGKLKIHREGGISREAFESYGIKTWNGTAATMANVPGNFLKHYSPLTPVQIIDAVNEIPANVHHSGLIYFGDSMDVSGFNEVKNISPQGNLNECARNLFGTMRNMDRMNLHCIYILRFPNKEIGRALNDRIERAAVKRKIKST